MIYSIENEFISAKIDEKGAELISLKLKDDGCEYIWQGDEKYWTGHSPIMFPICGRLVDGKYTYRGKEYELGCHGFARHMNFELVGASDNEITLSLASSEQTKAEYPFDFVLFVSFSLSGKSLSVKYKVVNNDSKNLIFTVGAHPAFNVPLTKGESFDDYYVEFENECDAVNLALSARCFCDGNDDLFTQGALKSINLSHSLFDNDAIFLYNTSKKASLLSKKSKKSVTMTFDNFKYLGLWHKPQSDAPYICIEPWCGCPDFEGTDHALEGKPDMIHMPSGYSFATSYKIEIK
jgi:galactose mutarotase-like enzyme